LVIPPPTRHWITLLLPPPSPIFLSIRCCILPQYDDMRLFRRICGSLDGYASFTPFLLSIICSLCYLFVSSTSYNIFYVSFTTFFLYILFSTSAYRFSFTTTLLVIFFSFQKIKIVMVLFTLLYV